MSILCDSGGAGFTGGGGEPLSPASILEQMCNEADSLKSQKRYDEALKIMLKIASKKKGIKLEDLCGEIYFCCSKLDPDYVIKEMDGLLSREPDSFIAHYNKGMALKQLGKIDAGIEHLKETAKLKPKYIWPLIRLFQCHWELKDYASALKVIKKARALCPKRQKGLYLNLSHNEATTLQMLERYPEAISIYRKILRADKTLDMSRESLIWTLVKMGNYTQAIRLGEKAVKTYCPNNWKAYESLRHAFHLKGDFEKAVAAGKRAAELAPAQGGVNYNLACGYSRTNNIPESEKYLKKAIGLDAKYAEMAKEDVDFEKHRESPWFMQLIQKRGTS